MKVPMIVVNNSKFTRQKFFNICLFKSFIIKFPLKKFKNIKIPIHCDFKSFLITERDGLNASLAFTYELTLQTLLIKNV